MSIRQYSVRQIYDEISTIARSGDRSAARRWMSVYVAWQEENGFDAEVARSNISWISGYGSYENRERILDVFLRPDPSRC